MKHVDYEAFARVVQDRRSVRGFLPTLVESSILQSVFALAQTAPSNCNTQPWQVCVVSGVTAARIKTRLSEYMAAGVMDMDYPFIAKYEGEHRVRQCDAAAALYGAMGIERQDFAGRHEAFMRNFQFFDAPYAALLFLPQAFAVREAADLGMYAQNLMLSLTAHGLASCAQAALSFHASMIREELGLGDDMRLLFGISFGYEDKSVSANNTRVGRENVEKVVKFYD